MTRAEAHAILGTSAASSEADIKKAYRQLASRHHPDKNKGSEEEAKKKFQEVATALSVLEGRGPTETPSPQGFTFNFNAGADIVEILNSFWAHQRGARPPPGDTSEHYTDNWGASGPGRHRTAPPGVQQLLATIGISLREAFFGCTKTIEIPDPSSISGSPTTVVIPPGVNESTVIKEITTPTAHVRVTIKIQSEYALSFGNLLNQGAGDVFKDLAVSPLLMITGGFLRVETLDGAVMSVRVPAGIQAGSTLRLQGKGYWTSSSCEHRGSCMLRLCPLIQRLEEIDRAELSAFAAAAAEALTPPSSPSSMDEEESSHP